MALPLSRASGQEFLFRIWYLCANLTDHKASHIEEWKRAVSEFARRIPELSDAVRKISDEERRRAGFSNSKALSAAMLQSKMQSCGSDYPPQQARRQDAGVQAQSLVPGRCTQGRRGVCQHFWRGSRAGSRGRYEKSQGHAQHIGGGRASCQSDCGQHLPKTCSFY